MTDVAQGRCSALLFLKAVPYLGTAVFVHPNVTSKWPESMQAPAFLLVGRAKMPWDRIAGPALH